MKKPYKHRQAGFTVVAMLLVIAVLVVVSVVASVVITQTNKQTDQKVAGQQQIKQPTPENNNSNLPTDTNSTSGHQTYLEISEWGVRIPLDVGVYDMQYKIQGADRAELVTTKLQGYGCDYGYGSFLVRNTNKDNLSAKYIKKIGNYYYGYVQSQSACAKSTGPNDPLNTEATNIFNAIGKSVENVEATN